MISRQKIAQTILETARERGISKSTCPSEIARDLFPKDWHNHMVEVREVAIALHKSGNVVITQKRQTIDPDHIKGPIRIRSIAKPVISKCVSDI